MIKNTWKELSVVRLNKVLLMSLMVNFTVLIV